MSLSLSERQSILALLRKEVVPALGCTEPIAVALAAARAAETLGRTPERLYVEVSPNLLKNGMGVVVPGTGECGLGVAAAAGALAGKSSLGLECLRDLDPQQAQQACAMAASDAVELALPDNDILLYCAVTASAGSATARAELRDSHDNITRVWKDGVQIFGQDEAGAAAGQGEDDWPLSLARVYDFAMHAPLEELSFILEAARMNRSVAEEGLRKEYGLGVGRSMEDRIHRNILSDDMATFAIKLTAAAADARMAGVQMAVMSNSGSGNQGIAATLPVVVYAEDNCKSEEELIRALTLSHLTAIYIKQNLGKLSALCGCVVAATGSSCGITYLMGGGYDQVADAVQNMIANLTGMICDGAKPSCALKVTSGVATAVFSAILAMEGKCVSSVEGIIENDVDLSIRNLTQIGSKGMNETDKMVLDIMTHKHCD